MTASYLTTDIVVIIVLVVVLILIGLCAFFTHFYWTKIGVAEIWNTAKWSSMRSSFYHTMRRFSRASSKVGSERPFSAASAYSEDSDGSALPAPLRNKKPNVSTNLDIPPSTPPPPNNQLSTSLKNSTTHNNARRNSRNQIQPVSTVSYNNPGRTTDYGTKIGQSLENTKIHNIHENVDRNENQSVDIESHRF